MSETTVRVSGATHEVLKKLSRTKQRPMQAILEMAVEEYRRRQFLENVNAAYADLRKDPAAWEAVQADRRAWDDACDGLPQDKRWTAQDRAVSKKKVRGR